MENPDTTVQDHQVMISVSKKNFKKAVERNLIKRMIREAYRLNKNLLTDKNKLCIAYIYSVKEILPSAQIHERLVKTFKRFDYVEKK
jgi:ribonuclease P protein component